MLIKTYNFYGKHANYISALTESTDENIPAFFKRNIDVMFAACIIGYKLNRKTGIDRATDAKKKTVLNEQIVSNQTLIQFLYRLIILLDESIDLDLESRVKIAFDSEISKIDENDDTDSENEQIEEVNDPYEKLFYQYILGGIEYLYENLIGNGKDPIINMGQLIDEFVINNTTDNGIIIPFS